MTDLSAPRPLPPQTGCARSGSRSWPATGVSQHGTIGHARDWLALSMFGDEAQGAVRAFVERRIR